MAKIYKKYLGGKDFVFFLKKTFYWKKFIEKKFEKIYIEKKVFPECFIKHLIVCLCKAIIVQKL